MCDCSNKEPTPIYRESFVRDASIALMSQIYPTFLHKEPIDWKIEAEVAVGVAEALWQVFAERMQNPTQ